MREIKRFSKIVLIDSLAGLCFVGVILFGWLPGPGGIPLFLAGLTLLAINHDWAKRTLEKARSNSKAIKKFFFPDWEWAHYAYDIGSFLIAAGAIYLLFTVESRILASLCLAAIFFSIAIFLVNRERVDRLIATVKKQKHKRL